MRPEGTEAYRLKDTLRRMEYKEESITKTVEEVRPIYKKRHTTMRWNPPRIRIMDNTNNINK